MDRSSLGGFGADLPDGELAQALAALCALGASQHQVTYYGFDVDEAVEQLLRSSQDGLCGIGVEWITRSPDAAAAMFAKVWRAFLIQHPHPRLEIQGFGLTAQWLARICQHPKVGAGSVYLRMDEPTYPVAWEWPLRLGVLGLSKTSPSQMQLTVALESVGFRNLWTVVDMEQPAAECELLLLPGDLRQGLADVLDAPHRPRADCVLVLGENSLSDARQFALQTALRHQAMTAGVAVLAKGACVSKLLTELVRELSHDATLDKALFRATRSEQKQASLFVSSPQLLLSRTLAVTSSVRLAAARVVHQYSAVYKSLRLRTTGLDRERPIVVTPPTGGAPRLAAKQLTATANKLVHKLQERVEKGLWKLESGEASDLVQIRDEITLATRHQHRSARMTGTNNWVGPVPPQPVEAEDHREMLIQIINQETESKTPYLKSGSAYRLRAKISIPQSGFTAAGTQFPSRDLPPSSTGHQLDVTFIQLTTNTDGECAAPQQRQIFLAPEGESTYADFVFHTHGMEGVFRSRLLVSHQNRILQILRIDGELSGPRRKTPYTFGVENLVQPGFQNLAYQTPFDAALVVNHSPQGAAGITLLSGSSVCSLEPAGMSEMQEGLQQAISNETTLRETGSSLSSDSMTDLLYALMQHGRLLYDYLETQLGFLDREASRIQVVEARPGAYFPVEFIYPLQVPPAKPPLCEHAQKALTAEVSHESCPYRDSIDHMCPMRFWGFNKLIERRASGKASSGDKTCEITVPTPLHAKLDLFNSAQVARSSRIQPADYDLPAGLLKTLDKTFSSLSEPVNWQQWKNSIAANSPGLLLLLPHSTKNNISNLPALEISDDVLHVAALETGYVKGPKAEAPVVFLMTCSGVNPAVGFLNFVERFKLKQAALVVGTLSTISAQRAARFLELALPIFAANKGRPFGEVFLEVKRTALAKGDGFALSLVAYGDMNWQL